MYVIQNPTSSLSSRLHQGGLVFAWVPSPSPEPFNSSRAKNNLLISRESPCILLETGNLPDTFKPVSALLATPSRTNSLSPGFRSRPPILTERQMPHEGRKAAALCGEAGISSAMSTTERVSWLGKSEVSDALRTSASQVYEDGFIPNTASAASNPRAMLTV